MKVIQLHPGLGQQVFDRLNELQSLPNKGILAGQAVASVLDLLADKGQSPINDLDIFYFDSRTSAYQRLLQKTKMLQLTSATHVDLQALNDDSYSSFQAYLSLLSKYTLKAVDRNGLLNRVYVNMNFDRARALRPNLPPTQAFAMAIIEEFDINCTQVAVDLHTKQLVWTKAYEQFFTGRQLQFCTAHTPSHSLVRILKKKQELENSYLREEEAFLVCASITQSKWFRELTNWGLVAPMFGSKIKAQFDCTPGWSSYFELQPHLVTLVPRGERVLHLLNESPATPAKPLTKTFYSARGRQLPDQKLQQRVDSLGLGGVKWVADVVRSELNKCSTKARVYYKMHEEHHELEFKETPAALLNQKHYQDRTAGVFFKSKNSWLLGLCQVLQGAQYFEKANFSDKSFQELANFLDKHSRLGKYFIDKPLRTQMEYFKTLKGLVSTFKSEVPIALVYQNDLWQYLDRPEVLQQLVNEFLQAESQESGVTPLNLEGFKASTGVKLQELYTKSALKMEGEQMRHCVGGYFSAVKSGRTRIFSLSSGTTTASRSTLELRVVKAVKSEEGGLPVIAERFTVVQHRAFANGYPKPENCQVAQELAEFLSEQSLMQAYEKRAKDMDESIAERTPAVAAA